MRKTIIFTVLFAGIFSLSACKKTDTTDTTPSLSGLVINEAVPYVAIGEELVFKANTSGLIVSKGTMPSPIGIYWQVNSSVKDTLSTNVKIDNPEFKYRADTLGSYSVACYAFGAEVYNASAITSFKAIDPSAAIGGILANDTATINGKVWTARNYNGGDKSGFSYKNASVVDNLFGRFYTWEDAQEICPDGWHLPTAEEWDSLGEDAGELMGDARFLGDDMWVPALGQEITNSYGFNAIPVGYMDGAASMYKFRRYGEMAAFWTASDAASDASLAQFRYILYDSPKLMKGNGDKNSLALSVRCVKD